MVGYLRVQNLTNLVNHFIIKTCFDICFFVYLYPSLDYFKEYFQVILQFQSQLLFDIYSSFDNLTPLTYFRQFHKSPYHFYFNLFMFAYVHFISCRQKY